MLRVLRLFEIWMVVIVYEFILVVLVAHFSCFVFITIRVYRVLSFYDVSVADS